MTNKVKKIITGGFEFVKDSASQLAKTFSPDSMVKQALGQQRSEFSEYLKSLGPDLSKDELEKKKKELKEEEEKKLKEARKTIKSAIPPHLQVAPKPPGLRAYEATIREEEQKKALQVEAIKKTPAAPVITPSGKQPRGMLFAKRKQVSKGIEGLVKDTKVG